MHAIEQIMYYVNMVGICTIISLMTVAVVLYYFLKVKKITVTVENINTASFRREDAISYVPIKDIVSATESLDSDGMFVITDTMFVGGVTVRGFEYPSASLGEKIDAQIQSVAFFNVVETPTAFRQSLKSVDLSPNIEDYQQVVKRIATEQMELDAEYRATLVAAEDYEDNPEMYETYVERLEELQRNIYAKDHMLKECQAVISYMTAMGGDVDNKDTAVGERTAQIMFSYEFNPDNYSEELTKEEIYLKALEALDTKANAYKEALDFCHFKAKRLSAKDLFGLMYKCTSPITAEDVSVEELLDSSYTSLFVSSNSLVETMIEKIGEDRYKEQVEQYEKELALLLKEQQLDREREARLLKESVEEVAREEMLNRGEALQW